MTLVVFAWLLIIRPLDDALSNARERHGDAVVALAEARARAALIAGIERAEPASLGASVDTIVSAAAVAAGFSGSRISSGERRVGKECVSKCRTRGSPYH